VPEWDQFNKTEYTTAGRRFLLGAVTYYEGPGVWAYEIAPYDNADAEMKSLEGRIPIITTEELYAGIDYQALNLGTGLYTSRSGDPNDVNYPVVGALRTVWSSVWFFRAFEERSSRNISHTDVGMAILVHHSFPDEEANGVALTANPFDESGIDPGFYVNVQVGEVSVVQPTTGVTSDQFIYHYSYSVSGQPITFIDHSSLVASGQTVLTNRQVYDLGTALEAASGTDAQFGIWHDDVSGLDWMNPPADTGLLWTEAVSYCDGFALEGICSYYWSSSPDTDFSDTHAWNLFFYKASITTTDTANIVYQTRCVRGPGK
jgi:hypothetical protein